MSNTSISAFIILALSIGYVFVYSPMGDLSILKEKKQGYEETLKTISNIEGKKQELLTEFENISEADKQNIDTIVPTSQNFMRLISQIDAVASKYNISISDITSAENSSSDGDSINTAQAKPYKSVIIGFSFDSSYKNFKLFMNDLEKSLRILDVRSVDLVAGEGGINEYSVNFETYWLN